MSEAKPEARVQFNVLIPAPLKARIQHLAIDEARTVSDLVTDVLQRYADQRRK